MKNIIRTVYSIVAGALLLAAPAHAISFETFGNITQGSKKAIGYALFFGGCTAAGMAAKWLYDTFISRPQNHERYAAMNRHLDNATQIRNIAQHNAERIKPELEKQDAWLDIMGLNLNRAGKQAHALPQAARSAGQTAKQVHDAARIVVEQQNKTRADLERLVAAQKANRNQIGIAAGLLPVLHMQLQSQHARELGHLHNAGQSLNKAGRDLDAASQDLEQSEKNVHDTQKNVRRGFRDIHALLDQQSSREAANRGRVFMGQRPIINQQPILVAINK